MSKAKAKTAVPAKDAEPKKTGTPKGRNPSDITLARQRERTTLTRIKKHVKSFEKSFERTASRNQYRAKGLLGPVMG